ncbi:MBL fold metallo-hydrolase [filamentous cyanobacterium LEGE 11480]|uniref:MBL fold metallo-hydrolase n=1 Tax=Romeriopsis navalis LEGE 11480 TaxID=2777977 RepID=A0A928VRP5_9CYAN|nr:MBL fold metallo-hydrolase [Romeriopsis navalis]MBE9032517.1 MBL fold metallo-hydrolase [Romeriopsis navalis LEGE 11480]
MKRRQLIQYAGAGLASAIGSSLWGTRSLAQSGGVTIRSLGHMSFLFSGNGLSVLSNPFRSLGCTAGLPAPKVKADLVLISSQLLDEGAVDVVPGNPRLLYEPGNYEVSGVGIQGIGMDHDRNGGRRFGKNVAWRWNQGGLNIIHLGGAATPINIEQKILMGSPDVLIIPVGGGPKAYNPEEAKAALQVLNPKIVIPMQYLTGAAKQDQCDLVGVDAFLKLMEGTPVRRPGASLSLLKSSLPKEGSVIQVLG